MRQNSDREYISQLLSITKRCLGDEAGIIISNGIRHCMEQWYDSFRLSIEYSGSRIYLRIPCSQMPEAWMNFLHIFCLDDYMLHEFNDVIRPGALIVDVGAFLGFFTLRVGLMMGKQGLIVAVEPNPLAREILYDNLSLNGFEEISRVDPRPVCGERGWRELIITGYWALSSINPKYVDTMGERAIKKVRLPCITLRDLLYSHGAKNVDLLKLDIEGGEAEVIERGFIDKVLERHMVRSMIVELHLFPDNYEKTLYSLARLLRETGYDVFEINPLDNSRQVIVAIK